MVMMMIDDDDDDDDDDGDDDDDDDDDEVMEMVMMVMVMRMMRMMKFLHFSMFCFIYFSVQLITGIVSRREGPPASAKVTDICRTNSGDFCWCLSISLLHGLCYHTRQIPCTQGRELYCHHKLFVVEF